MKPICVSAGVGEQNGGFYIAGIELGEEALSQSYRPAKKAG